jgi:hypothetical protein
MFAKVPKTINNLLSDIITKIKLQLKKKESLSKQFMEIKNKMLAVANKSIQKQLLDLDKI